jgi:hypothetical protein
MGIALVGKPQEKIHQGNCRWENNIEKDLREIRWSNAAQVRDQWLSLVNMAITFPAP